MNCKRLNYVTGDQKKIYEDRLIESKNMLAEYAEYGIYYCLFECEKINKELKVIIKNLSQIDKKINQIEDEEEKKLIMSLMTVTDNQSKAVNEKVEIFIKSLSRLEIKNKESLFYLITKLGEVINGLTYGKKRGLNFFINLNSVSYEFRRLGKIYFEYNLNKPNVTIEDQKFLLERINENSM